MNASLNEEQIKYIQSIVGETKLNYEKYKDEYLKEEFNERFYNSENNINYDELSDESDEYGYSVIENCRYYNTSTKTCKFIKQHKEEEYRGYNIAKNVYQIGDRFFEIMVISENRSEQQSHSDIISDYGNGSYNVNEVFPVKTITIDYV